MSQRINIHLMRLFRDFVHDESGAEAIEWIAMAALLILLLCGLAYGYNRLPELVDKSLVVAVFSAIVGGIAWSSKETVESLHQRAQLIILEKLSGGRSRTRDEIGTLLTHEGFVFRFLALHTDALADLTLSGKIGLDNGKYVIGSASDKLKQDGHNSLRG